MSGYRRKKPLDTLPGLEPFMPTNEADALLIWGSSEPYPNWYTGTDAAPGSAEKIRILRHRAAKGLPLFHPDDRQDHEGLFGLTTWSKAGRPDPETEDKLYEESRRDSISVLMRSVQPLPEVG